MKKKALLAAAFISVLLLSAVVGTQLVNLGRANPNFEHRFTAPPVISLHSPINKTYTSNVLLNFTVARPESWLGAGIGGVVQELLSVNYYIDGKYYDYASVGANNTLSSSFNYSVYLTDLSDGSHSVVVHAFATGVVMNWISGDVYNVPINSSSSDTVYFTLDTTPPIVSVLSEESMYETSEVPLNFTVNEPYSQISYALDGQENVTINGNTTLSGLSSGLHNVTVYAWDKAGNLGASETVYFSLEVPFPTMFVVTASGASVAVVCLGLLVYFKKRKS